jgi:HEAT repeats
VRSAGLGVATNNFPDVRMKACEYLGDFPTVDSKDTLVRVILNSKVEDPMVLAEAIRSLGKIGMNDSDEVVDAIAYSVNHFNNVGMSEDRLAVYTMFAFTDLADKGLIKDMGTVTKTIMNFTKGNYVGAVKKLAMQTLEKLAQYQAKSSAKK